VVPASSGLFQVSTRPRRRLKIERNTYLLVISVLRWPSPDAGEDLVASAGVAIVAVTGNAGVGIAPGVVARLVTEVAVLAAAETGTILTDFFFSLMGATLSAGWMARLTG
jgi:hypothetical protein